MVIEERLRERVVCDENVLVKLVEYLDFILNISKVRGRRIFLGNELCVLGVGLLFIVFFCAFGFS